MKGTSGRRSAPAWLRSCGQFTSQVAKASQTRRRSDAPLRRQQAQPNTMPLVFCFTGALGVRNLHDGLPVDAFLQFDRPLGILEQLAIATAEAHGHFSPYAVLL